MNVCVCVCVCVCAWVGGWVGDCVRGCVQYLTFTMQYTHIIYHYRNDDGSYKFNMTALCSFLNDEAAKSPTPSKFYNVQVFRYEVCHSYTIPLYMPLLLCKSEI